jgi:glycosyltransferase involved in cell wall biosynthesis
MQHGMFPGYVAPVGKEWAKNLARLGIDVSVVVIGKIAASSERFQFPVHCVENTNLLDIYRKLRTLARNFDVVHYFPSKGLELLPLLIPTTKFIFNRLSVSVSGKPLQDGIMNFVKRIQPIFASHVIFTDEPLAKTLRPFGGKPTSVLPVGYPADLFYPCGPFIESDERILIYHGAVRPQRQLDQLVRVLSKLPERYKLMIIGGGLPADEAYKRHLASVAASLNCTNRLILTNMSQSEIRAHIEKAYLCLSYVPVWDCYQDQFVLKTIEYLACHRPVMTTATRYSKGFSQAIGKDKILLTDGTVDDMAQQIQNADSYIRLFYRPDNLTELSQLLVPYSTEYIVKNRLLPIYEAVLTS